MDFDSVCLYYEKNYPLPPDEFRKILHKCKKEWEEGAAESFKLWNLEQMKQGRRKLKALKNKRYNELISDLQDESFSRDDEIKKEN